MVVASGNESKPSDDADNALVNGARGTLTTMYNITSNNLPSTKQYPTAEPKVDGERVG